MPFKPRTIREALTPETHTPLHKTTWLLRAAITTLGTYALLIEPTYTTKPLLAGSAATALLISLAFAFIPTTRPRTLKAAETGLLLAFTLHIMGHTLGWYQHYPWYDTLLHFSVPLVTVLILYALSQATNWIWNWKTVTPLEVGIYLFAMTITLGTLWEIYEYTTDTLLGTREQDNLPDTMIDLIMDTTGALIGSITAALATRHGRRKGHHRVSEEPKRPYPMRARDGASRE